MSQYPPNPNPNYDPYGQNPPNPNANTPGTSYGGPNQGGQNPYNPYGTNPPSGPGSGPNPNPNPNPYGYPPPPAPGGPAGTEYGSNPYAPNAPTQRSGSDPNYNPYDPYGQTVASQGPASGQNYGAYTPPPPPQPVPQPKRGGPSMRNILIAVIALVIIGGGVAVGLVSYNNVQKSNADATATAQANITATAHANATATFNANATATAIASTYPFSNNQVINDPLSDNNKGYNWQTGTFCQFTGNAFHVSDNQTNTFSTCFGTNTNFSNFTFEAEMVINKGDGGGLIFRGNVNTNQLYRVTFYTSGNYGVYVYVDNTGSNARILKYDTLPSGVDLTNTNTVSVVARGSTLTIYLNQTMLTSISDSTYAKGQIGFSAYDVTSATEAVFTNAKVWQLP